MPYRSILAHEIEEWVEVEKHTDRPEEETKAKATTTTTKRHLAMNSNLRWVH